MGLYVKVLPMYGRRELDEKEATAIAFELKAGRKFSQDRLEQAALGLGIVVPLVYTEREAAERDASRLGVVLAAWFYTQALVVNQAKQRDNANGAGEKRLLTMAK